MTSPMLRSPKKQRSSSSLGVVVATPTASSSKQSHGVSNANVGSGSLGSQVDLADSGDAFDSANIAMMPPTFPSNAPDRKTKEDSDDSASHSSSSMAADEL